MVHRVCETSFKEPVHQMVGHAARHRVRSYPGPINKSAAFFPVGHEAARFHLAQHGGHGSICKALVSAEHVVHASNGRFATAPAHLHDMKLKVAQSISL